MKRQLATLLLAALALTACADTSAPAAAPAPATPSASATATSDDGEASYLSELRRQQRSLTSEVADDEALLTLGGMGCKSVDDDELRQTYLRNATLTMGYTDGEARAAFQAAERHLC